jgi:hypothetical protein
MTKIINFKIKKPFEYENYLNITVGDSRFGKLLTYYKWYKKKLVEAGFTEESISKNDYSTSNDADLILEQFSNRPNIKSFVEVRL